MILQDKQGSKNVDIIGLLIAFYIYIYIYIIMKAVINCFNEIGLAASPVSFYFFILPI